MVDANVSVNGHGPPKGEVLTLTDIARLYGAIRAVDGVSLSLYSGEICGLVGPNGSGKTTLLNLISAFIDPSGGQVELLGQDVTKSPAHVMSRLGVGRTFQLVRLMPHETVLENVAGGLYWQRERGRQRVLGASRAAAREIDERVRATLERLNILSYADDVAATLPFGIQRRVEIARAVISEPSLLLLDEPAAGISESDLEELGKTMRQERDRGCSVLLVDHHLRFVLDLCPRLVVLNYGQMIFDGEGHAAANDPVVREAYMGS